MERLGKSQAFLTLGWGREMSLDSLCHGLVGSSIARARGLSLAVTAPRGVCCRTGCTFQVLKVKVAQLCPTLCDPMDYTVHGILQARILEWVAFPFSRGSSQPRGRTGVSCIAGGFLPTEPSGFELLVSF